MIGVYGITCLANGRFYIGASKDVWSRIISHVNLLQKNKHHCKGLQKDYNEYGYSNFRVGIIQECLKQNLGVIEKWYIKNTKNAYNVRAAWTSERPYLYDTKSLLEVKPSLRKFIKELN